MPLLDYADISMASPAVRLPVEVDFSRLSCFVLSIKYPKIGLCFGKNMEFPGNLVSLQSHFAETPVY